MVPHGAVVMDAKKAVASNLDCPVFLVQIFGEFRLLDDVEPWVADDGPWRVVLSMSKAEFRRHLFLA